VIEDIKFTFNRFNANGGYRSFDARVSMTELRTTFRARNTIRSYFDHSDTPEVQESQASAERNNEARQASLDVEQQGIGD
jgi:hypothetical protein